MTKLLYNIFIQLYYCAIWFASFFNKKAALWVDGRKHWQKDLKQQVADLQQVVWMHCASLGEFEQGRPLIESLKKQTNYSIVLSFYSPSGFEIKKNYPQADVVCYLPLDTAKNAKQFLDIVRPEKVIFVKYEIWYHFLHEIQKRNIPSYLISALFRSNHFFFKWYGKFFLEKIQGFTHVFVQDENSQTTLQIKGQKESIVAGDTRIDRVLQIAQNAAQLPLIAAFCQDKKVLIAGSTWPQDEAILLPFIQQLQSDDWKFIIAPHEIHSQHIEAITKQIQDKSIAYSQANLQNVKDKKVLIIDNIGLLSKIYQYGKIAYIGGGFGVSIHNILEPAVFKIPVIFGPKYQKFSEARILVEQGGAFSIQDSNDFKTIFEQLQEQTTYQKAQQVNQQFFEKNRGATQKIMEWIFR